MKFNYLFLAFFSFAASALSYYGLKEFGVGIWQRVAVVTALIVVVLLVGILLNRKM